MIDDDLQSIGIELFQGLGSTLIRIICDFITCITSNGCFWAFLLEFQKKKMDSHPKKSFKIIF